MATDASTWIPLLRHEISKSMQLLEDDANYFITKEDLDSAWNIKVEGKPSLVWLRETVHFFCTIKDEGFFNHWVKVISILIWMRYENPLEFVSRHVRCQWSRTPTNAGSKRSPSDEVEVAEFRDDHLPFTTVELSENLFEEGISGTEGARDFYKSQFAFLPIVLQENKTFDYEEPYRLPLVPERQVEGDGAYSMLTKVKIVRRHYQYKSNVTNTWKLFDEAFYAARKEFEIGVEWAREYKNLEILRSGPLQHDRITQCFTSGTIGTKYYLFFPWADLDLEMFLEGKYLQSDQERFITPFGLMQEAIKLLGALRHLHEDVKVDGASVVFSHLDLKPSNILIMRDETAPHILGKWKITDFGVSGTEPRKQSSSRRGSTWELYAAAITPREVDVDLPRHPDHYQPPEAEDEIASIFKDHSKAMPGDKSDIWSYGCILLAVLAFAIGGRSATEELSEVRNQGDQCADGQYRFGRFYRVEADEHGEHFLCLPPQVLDWFGLQAQLAGGWLLELWDIVAGSMLKIYPEDRKSARQLIDQLETGQIHQSPRTNIWHKRPSALSQSERTGSVRGDVVPTRPRSLSRPDFVQPNFSGTEPRVTRKFKTRYMVDLNVPSDKEDVMISADCSRILYRNDAGVQIFSATEDGSEHTIFTSDGCRSFARNASSGWDQAVVAGHYLSLRETPKGKKNAGEIQIHDLESGDWHCHNEWMNEIDNRHVHAICISSAGFVGFRFSHRLVLFNSSGTVSNAVSEAMNFIGEAIKDVAFDRDGRILTAISSSHWMVKNLDDDSNPIVGRHGLHRGEHGKFSPVLIPFVAVPGFIIHDAGDSGRCAVVTPGNTPQTTGKRHLFNLNGEPRAITITPDNKRLVYVTVSRSFDLFPASRYTYTLRSRAINIRAKSPVGTGDDTELKMFVEKKLKISIATVSRPGGYVVLSALANGRVEAFDLPDGGQDGGTAG